MQSLETNSTRETLILRILRPKWNIILQKFLNLFKMHGQFDLRITNDITMQVIMDKFK